MGAQGYGSQVMKVFWEEKSNGETSRTFFYILSINIVKSREKSMKIGIYCRVSTEAQADEGYSIKEQQTRLEAYAKAQGWDIYKTYVDAGWSGGNTDRPALTALIGDVKDRKISAVVVYKLDRLSRSTRDALALIEDVFKPNGCALISITENIDTASPTGQFTTTLLSAVAQMERSMISERTKMGKEASLKSGHWQGFKRPSGYRFAGNGVLEIDEYEASVIKEGFSLYLSGRSFSWIREEMRQKYGKHWNWRPILHNKIYIGIIEYKGISYQGNHKPIIDTETFEAVQKRLPAVKSKTVRLVSGLCKCGKCGCFLYYSTSGRNNYLRCRNADKKLCEGILARVPEVEEAVMGELASIAIDPKRLTESREEVKVFDKEPLIQQIEKLKQKRSKLVDLYSEDLISKEEFRTKVEKIDAEIKSLEDVISEHEKEDKIVLNSTIINKIANLLQIMDQITPKEQNMVLRSIIDKIVVFEGRIEIYWK